MSMWKAAVLGLLIPAAQALPAAAQEAPGRAPEMIFAELDVNGDGAVTLDEMQNAQATRFEQADTNNDGVLDREELLAGANERVERRIDRMIERADTDGDGAVSVEEMAEVRMGRRGPSPERIFERIDADGDGSVTAAEFQEAAEAMRERHGGRGGLFGQRDRG